MNTAIVTGAAGFLGSHLCERLLIEGYSVIGLDNYSTGLRENIQHLQKQFGAPKFQFIEFDVVGDWQKALAAMNDSANLTIFKNLKYIFHFASPASPPLYQKLSLETIWANTIGLQQAIQFADHYQARVIFASTSEVYGDPSHSPQSESYWGNVNSFGPRSCYDEAKRCGEAIIYSSNQRFKTSHGLVRIFNTYGPRMNPNDGRVVINFLVQALQGKNLTVYGDGKQTRSFCYVDDLVEAIIRYAHSPLTEPVNIGNTHEFTVLQLAEIIQKMFADKKPAIEFKPLPGDDPLQRRPDTTKAHQMLNQWRPQIELAHGLELMKTWLQAHPELYEQTKGNAKGNSKSNAN